MKNKMEYVIFVVMLLLMGCIDGRIQQITKKEAIDREKEGERVLSLTIEERNNKKKYV